MIPKIIHYCWFGGHKKPNFILNCINSWKIFFPDYEIIEWNETNFPLNHPFVINAIKFKLWAFVADFARVSVLKNYGGIYLDTDMFFIKPLPNHFLQLNSFAGAEDSRFVSAGIIGTVKNSLFISDLFNYYNTLGNVINYHDFVLPQVITNRILKLDSEIKVISCFNGLTVFLPEYFYPLPYKSKNENWQRFVTPNTICIHLWNASWHVKQNFSFYENIRNKLITIKYHLISKIHKFNF